PRPHADGAGRVGRPAWPRRGGPPPPGRGRLDRPGQASPAPLAASRRGRSASGSQFRIEVGKSEQSGKRVGGVSGAQTPASSPEAGSAGTTVPGPVTPEQDVRRLEPGLAPVADTVAPAPTKTPPEKDRIWLAPPVPVEGEAEESTTGLKEELGPGRDRSI